MCFLLLYIDHNGLSKDEALIRTVDKGVKALNLLGQVH